MLAHTDHDNIADYFPVQSFSWAVGKHWTGNFLAIFNIAYVIFLQKHVCAIWGNIAQVIFFVPVLSQTYLGNID